MNGLLGKNFISLFCSCAIFLIAVGEPADAAGESEIDIASTGLPGINKVGKPLFVSPQITLAGTSGYGVTESLGEVEGSHHRLFGRLALGAHVAPWLGLALNLDGRFDRHPRDDRGVDYGASGEPRFLVRAGGALTNLFHLGGEIELLVPGRKAPSLEWSGTTVDLKFLPALSPEDGSWFVGLLAGVRLDQSANAAPDLARLRPGDRISLGLSDYHAVLLGLGGSYRWSRTELVAELSWDILVGDGAPSPAQSPLRANLGVRRGIVDNLFAELLTEVSMSTRPGVGPEDSLVPIEPRFGVFLGLRYVFDFRGDEADSDAEPESQMEAPPAPVPASAPIPVSVSGSLVDPAGEPVAEADVSLALEDGTELAATTDGAGRFVLEDVPQGSSRLTATASGFEPGAWDILVEQAPLDLGQRTLNPLEEVLPSSQLRGLVRSFSGKKIPAKVVVEPIGAELTCDEDGMFQLDVPPGKYTVIVSAPGFVKQTRTVKVEENGVSILNIDLRRKKRRR